MGNAPRGPAGGSLSARRVRELVDEICEIDRARLELSPADREFVTLSAEATQRADAIRWGFEPRAGDDVAGATLVKPIDGANGAWLSRRSGGAQSVTRVFPTARLEEVAALDFFVDGIRAMRLLRRPDLGTPDIIPVSRVDESLLAWSMPLLRGGDIGHGQHRFWRPRQRLDFLGALVEAVAHVHSKGYVHGSLRPGNVLVQRSNLPLLTDFGAPRPGRGDRRGGAAFIAPELRPQGSVPTPRGDVYALGKLVCMVLCGLVAGPKLHSGIAAVGAHKLPRKLRDVITRATADDPAQRFGSASEMLGALKAGSGRWATLRLSQTGPLP